MASAARTFTCALRSTPTATFRTTATRNTARLAAPRQAFRQQSRRGYADSAGPKPSSNASYWAAGLGAAGVLGGGYYFYTHNTSPSELAKQSSKEDNKGSSKTPAVFKPSKSDYQKAYDAIAARLSSHDEYDDGSYGPVLLRLGWHASGTYDRETNTGGSNGATMRFAPEGDHGANAGLKAARDFLEPVKEQYPWISYSDLWTLAAVCAIQEMQGPSIPWRPGRADRDVGFCTPDGRLPDGSKDQKHLRAIFGRMGFCDQEIVALSGAHALGRCHTDRSGFEGPWTFSPTTLTNDYYKLLLDEAWSWRKWDGPRQFQDVKSKSLMMLPTDMALIKDKGFRPWVEKYARDNESFFKDFSRVIMTLFELGVPFQTGEEARMTFRSSFDE